MLIFLGDGRSVFPIPETVIALQSESLSESELHFLQLGKYMVATGKYSHSGMNRTAIAACTGLILF
jgi:hypothetical protein